MLHDLSESNLNGQHGAVTGWDEPRGRYHVALEVGGNSLSVRPSNVRQIVSEARVVGTSQPRLNGRIAAAATFDPGSKRYRVEGLTENGLSLALKPENVLLPPRCRVKVCNVQSRPEINGRSGSIVEVQGERYVVELPSSELSSDGLASERISLRLGAVAAC